MDKPYNFIGRFLIPILFLALPFYSYSTHIVGGELTYVHNSDSTYTITLKLWRDCSGIALPGTVTIKVRKPDGSQYSPSKDFNINLTSSSILPQFVDTCVIKPNVCVQQGIYTKVVNNLPSGTGGYHMWFDVCCRNGSLNNIQNPLSTGASFYSHIPDLATIWNEDFTLPNNTTVDAGATAWTRSVQGGTVYAKVNNNLFEVSKTNGDVFWTSQLINISGRPGGVNLDVDLFNNGGAFGATDSIQAFYKLDGGALVPFPTNGVFVGSFAGIKQARAPGLVGNTVQIIVKMNNHNNSGLYRMDNVLVYDKTISNDSPTFVNFPPIFICNGNPLVFDHSATDTNGDSLVYSLYTPYTDAAPTFPGNVATFGSVVYNAGFGQTNPLGGAAGSLAISSTGIITGTPSLTGQFVVGVKVKEFRNGVLINELTRDFQFNVLNCPPPGKASFAPAKVCSGKALTFNNTSPAAMTLFSWTFGDPASGGSNTSTLRNPTHTFSAVGSYTVRLISNPNSACADTFSNIVTVSSVTAAYIAPAPSCVGKVVSFTDASTATGTTVTGWLWNFGDGTTSTLKNPTHTYAVSGTMSIKLVATNGFGCQDSVTHTVVIQALPVVAAGPNQTVCANNQAVTLAGSVVGAAGGSWSSPTLPVGNAGTFAPNNTTLNATYTPSATEIAAGTVTLTLASTGNGNCNAVTSTMTITIVPAPIVSAGGNKTVCANNASVAITGTVTNAGGGTWTGGGGTFFPNANTLTMTYTPSAAELAGPFPVTVPLTLTSTGNGTCNPVTSTMTITITAPPTISAGGNQTVCANNAVTTLAGTKNAVVTAVQWTSTGTGVFSAPTNP
ncbi:MAG TPA: PKD domain-containing protein, partial [Cytophagaceae bacterium]|nr:PKD domain-containing protein [Cytophagaceae bacterium]